MDFLTTNFTTNDDFPSFNGPFKLLDLPLEIILKICIFLDAPDLQNISMCCTYLRVIANERFIYRSKFYYIQEKIGLSLSHSIRPTLKSLYQRNIIPSSSTLLYPSFNVKHFLLMNSLQKSFKQDKLSKKLNKRPSKEELKRINILPSNKTSSLIKDKVKRFQVELNISDMIDVLPKFYKEPAYRQSRTLDQTKKNKLYMPGNEITDDFTSFYLDFLKNAGDNDTASSILQSSISASSDGHISSLSTVLNHINISKTYSNKIENPRSFKRAGENSSVQLRKQFFENLQNQHYLPADTIPHNDPNENDVRKKKPSKTVLKAVIEENSVSYEKMF